MTDHLDNDKDLSCGHKAIDWDGKGNCIACARDLILGKDSVSLETHTELDKLVFKHEDSDKQAWCCLRDESVRKAIYQYTQSKLKAFAGEQKYQTHISKIRTLKNGKDVWGIRIAYQAQQVYGDIADSKDEAEKKLVEALKAIKEKAGI